MTSKSFASVVRADSKPGYTTLDGIVSEEAKRARLETARIRRLEYDAYATTKTDGQQIIPSVIDILANLKIRLDSVKRMTQIQNTSYSFAETKYFRVAAREHTLAPPGRHRPRHSRMANHGQ